MQFRSLGWEDHLEKGMATNSSILAGESHGQRSLVGYGPQGCKELDITEMTQHARVHNSHTCTLLTYKSVIFSIFRVVQPSHHYLISERFLYPQMKVCIHQQSLFILPYPYPGQPLVYFLCLYFAYLEHFMQVESYIFEAFCVRLL